MSDGMIGKGTIFGMETTAGNDTYTALAYVFEITPPTETVDAIDLTHMSSPDFTREFGPGLINPGEVTLALNFIPGNSADVALRGAMREARGCRVTFPNGATWTFDAFITSLGVETPMADKMVQRVTMQVTGSKVVGAPS
jgi:hypothetical protein